MIRILFIIPYPEMQKKVETVICNLEDSRNIRVDTIVKRVEEVEDIKDIAAGQYDAVVARGYSAILTEKKFSNIPTICINVSAYDVVRTVFECIRLYEPSKIGFCTNAYKVYEIEEISRMLNTEIKVYTSIRHEKLNYIVGKAKDEGCDCIIGGYSACFEAEKQGVRAVVIRSGENAILQALEEAVRTAEQVKREREISEMYKTIIYSSQEGILYVNNDGIIKVRNRTIKRMTGGKSLMDRELGKAIPYLAPLYEQTIKTGEEKQKALINIPDTRMTVSASSVPVMVNNEISGVVLRIADITKIQSLEEQIRRKLNGSGLIAKYRFEDIIHGSRTMKDVIETARSFAKSDSNVIIVGETGTGKELFAQSIHNESRRKNGPFVVINCAAISENLLESELFGYSEGAFTGASRGGKMGLFEQAHGGTLFLDEVSEISVATQTKLLRVLQEHQVRRIGDNRVIDVDVRIIAASNKNIRRLCAEGRFRNDLMYRLDVLRLFVPNLASRDGDVEIIFRYLIQAAASREGRSMPTVENEALHLLKSYPFFGNIRELGNIAERIIATHRNGHIGYEDMYNALYPKDLEYNEEDDGRDFKGEGAENESRYGIAEGEISNTNINGENMPSGNMYRGNISRGNIWSVGDENLLKGNEEARIKEALSMSSGNKTMAAKLLGIDRSTLWRKMKKYGIE